MRCRGATFLLGSRLLGLGVLIVVADSSYKGAGAAAAQAPDAAPPVTAERLAQAADEPHNWLMYAGSYASNQYSALAQIDRDNIADMRVEWVHQFRTLSTVETSPIVADGLMVITESPSNVIALDAATGRPYWKYTHPVPRKLSMCCGLNNRGVAILGDRVYVGTVDGRLLALDLKTGSVVWNAEVAHPGSGYSITAAPLIVKDKVITGVAGGEYGIRGFLDAYDVDTGERLWRFYTIPGKGEDGNDSWGDGDSWKHGGAPTWLTGSYDPELDLLYWGTGNPSPDWNGDVRPGDNLYANSVVALDPKSGQLRWHHQFTPHDTHDWDANQTMVLMDAPVDGTVRKLLLTANRNAFYYVIDRETGEFLRARAYAKQTWASGIDEQGRPILIPGLDPNEEGVLVYPGWTGGTNWWSPSYSRSSGLFYVRSIDAADVYYKRDEEYVEGDLYYGGTTEAADHMENVRAAIRALDPLTGDLRWEYPITPSVSFGAGILTTAGGLLFSGTVDGYLFALDDRTGDVLWHLSAGGTAHAAPMTYSVEGRQFISVAVQNSLLTFALPQ